MLRVLSKKECSDHEKELQSFCKKNHCEMYNFMRLLKHIQLIGELNEQDRILAFIKKEKYLSKKRLVDFIKEPARKSAKAYAKKWSVKNVKKGK